MGLAGYRHFIQDPKVLRGLERSQECLSHYASGQRLGLGLRG